MESLYNKAENQKIIDRLNHLSNKSQAQWGKMNVAQMLAHCQTPFRVAFGELKLKRGIMGFLFGSLIRKKLTADEKPFDKSLPTDKSFLVVNEREFETEKNKLIALVQKFEQQGPSGLSKEKHPFFGNMSPKDWDIIMWKHLDHHLRQFGA
jgi:hypothetical protein